MRVLPPRRFKIEGRLREQTWSEFERAVEGKYLVLYGYSQTLTKDYVIRYQSQYGANAIYDKDPDKVGYQFAGSYMTIKHSSEMEQLHREKVIVLITTLSHQSEIEKELRNRGFYQIFSYYSMESKRAYFRIIKPFLVPLFSIPPLARWLYRPFDYYRSTWSSILFRIGGILRILRFPPSYRPYAHITESKSRHTGERCFIVATGPSLRLEDLELLKTEITFSVNGIFKLFKQTSWRPDYYVLEDYWLCNDYMSPRYHFRFEDMCKREAFVNNMCKPFLKHATHRKNVRFTPTCYVNVNPKRRRLKVSGHNLLFGVDVLFTVVITAIRYASHMGFREIYLVGADCDYSGPQQHAGEDGSLDKGNAANAGASELLAYQRMIRGYESIKKLMDKSGVKLFNATRGGSLEVFPRVSLNEVLGSKSTN
ncbi:6-hydroxymethylpterin diphosphokinase MptE-like protein [Gorillibacterium sp. CAU 1737]|uniref:6-hydroxymethylpterin diphosphokinase MptE-like protein n=1 Tax=Gorillibacterium sp. CAU 1737 TaxID=3140362 RepID=UPI0032604773